MGGAIALDLALRFPERVAGLGLVGTGARLRVAPAILASIREGMAGGNGPHSTAAARLICDWAFGPEAPPEMVRLARRQIAATPLEVLYGDFCACDAFDRMDSLGEIATPTCVVCGTFDALTPVKYSIYLRDRLPSAQLHLVQGAGHMVMIEKPKEVVRALLALLADPSLQAPCRKATGPD
jgi:pimeloyl-ACP methyl ester carboxylesterase